MTNQRKNVSLISEKKLEHVLTSYLITKEWWVRKLHGNVYQTGLPDLLVGRRRDGKLMLIEVKALKKEKRYTQLDLLDALRGPQVGSVLMLAKIRAAIYVIGGSSKGWLVAQAPFDPIQTLSSLSLEELYEVLNR